MYQFQQVMKIKILMKYLATGWILHLQHILIWTSDIGMAPYSHVAHAYYIGLCGSK